MDIQWNNRTYSKQDFINSWNSSASVAQCARRLNLVPSGGIYKTLNSAAKSLGLTKEHMSGQAWRTHSDERPGKTRRKPIDHYLVVGGNAGSTFLKKRLISEGLLRNACYAPFCPVPNPSIHPFTGEKTPLKLVLDHINGVNNDNRLANLRLLCNHCHAETDTFCGANVKKSKGRAASRTCQCGGTKKSRSSVCRGCNDAAKRASPRTKITWPETDVLLQELKSSSYVSVARRIGVSDTAIRTRLSKQGYNPKTLNKH